MKFKLLMSRKIQTTETIGPQPNVSHPLSALVMLGGVDQPRYNPVTTANAYNVLVGLGLPSGYTDLPGVASRPFSGFGLVGPSGLVPFKVNRVVHRVIYGAVARKGFGYIDLMANPLMIPPYNPNVQTPAGTILTPVNISAGSIYVGANGSQSVIALENNSFVSNNGSFSSIPGVVSTPRIVRGLPDVGAIMSTIVEMLPPTAIPGSAEAIEWGGRVLGLVPQPVVYNQLETLLVGNEVITNGQFISEWELEVDDNLISQVQSQTGKIYAMACATIPALLLNNEIDAGNSAYMSVDGTSYLPNIGSSHVMAIDITSLAGTQSVNGLNTDSGPISDFSNTPYATAVRDIYFEFGASINAPDWDIVRGRP